MYGIALHSLRFRTGGFVGTFVALTFGVAMIMACGGLLETGIRADVTAQRLAATQLAITGDEGDEADLAERVRLDRGLVATVAAVPGVASAAGDVSIPLTGIDDGDGVTASGHPWASAELAPYSMVDGAPPAGPGEVVLDRSFAGVRVGDEVDLGVRGRTERFLVTGIAAPADAVDPVDPVDEPIVFFSEADSFRLAERLDAIGVIAAPGADVAELRDRIHAALGDQPVRVLTGDDRWIAEFPDTPDSNESLIVLAALSGGFAVIVAMFVVASTLGLSVHHRLRELALLRAVGATPRQVRRMVHGETLLLTVLSGGLAAVLAPLLGGWLFDRLAALGVADAVTEFHLGWIPMAAGAGCALLVSLAAGSVAARRAGATRPVQALADAAIQAPRPGPLRTTVAALCFGCGIALAVVTVTLFDGPVAASVAGPSVVLWAIGVAAILPAILTPVVGWLRRPVLAVTGLPGYLAVTRAPARSVQLAAVVTPIMLASGIAIGNLYLPTTEAAAAREAFTADLRADAVLTSDSGTGLAPGLVDTVRTVPGVAGASEYVTSAGFVESPADPSRSREGRPLLGISADGAETTTAVETTAGRLTDLHGATVALPAEYARELGRGVGDRVTLRLGDGTTADLRIVALVDGAGGDESLLLPADLLAAHTTAGLPEQILVRAEPGTDPAALARTLTEHLADHPDVAVTGRSALTAATVGGPDVNASVSYLLAGMVLAYTVVSVVNTLVMATVRRRREFGLQRVTGSTRGQVLAMMAVEAALVATVGVVLGALLSTATLVPFSLAVGDSPVPSGPLSILLGVAGVAGVLTMVATLVPVWFATRGRPVHAAVAPG